MTDHTDDYDFRITQENNRYVLEGPSGTLHILNMKSLKYALKYSLGLNPMERLAVRESLSKMGFAAFNVDKAA